MENVIKLKLFDQHEIENNSMYEEDFNAAFNPEKLSGVHFSVPVKKQNQKQLDLNILQNDDIEKHLSYKRLLID